MADDTTFLRIAQDLSYAGLPELANTALGYADRLQRERALNDAIAKQQQALADQVQRSARKTAEVAEAKSRTRGAPTAAMESPSANQKFVANAASHQSPPPEARAFVGQIIASGRAGKVYLHEARDHRGVAMEFMATVLGDPLRESDSQATTRTVMLASREKGSQVNWTLQTIVYSRRQEKWGVAGQQDEDIEMQTIHNVCTCGSEVPSDARFCPHCGASLRRESPCSNCGTVLAEEARFCFHCGAPRIGAPIVGSSHERPNARAEKNSQETDTLRAQGIKLWIRPEKTITAWLEEHRDELHSGTLSALDVANAFFAPQQCQPHDAGETPGVDRKSTVGSPKAFWGENRITSQRFEEAAKEESALLKKLRGSTLGMTESAARPIALYAGEWFKTGDIAAAEPVFTALAAFVAYPGVENVLGECLSEHGAYAEALVHFDRALAMDDEDVIARRGRAEALVRTGRIEEGLLELAQLATAADTPPQNAQYARERVAVIWNVLRKTIEQSTDPAKLAEARGALDRLRERVAEIGVELPT